MLSVAVIVNLSLGGDIFLFFTIYYSSVTVIYTLVAVMFEMKEVTFKLSRFTGTADLSKKFLCFLYF